jgi:hypothetical protein
MCGYFDFGGHPAAMTIPRLFEAVTKPRAPGQQPCFNITRSYHRLAAVDIPDFKDNMGRPWKARAEEFDARLIDPAMSKVHGVLSGMVMCGQNINRLYGWIIFTSTRVSRPEVREIHSAATAIVQENFRIVRASELITRRILPRNNPYNSYTIMGHWEYEKLVEAESSRKYQEGIMGFESYHTPSRTQYEVPLNSIPGADVSRYINEQTGHIWNSALEPAPLGYVKLIR